MAEKNEFSREEAIKRLTQMYDGYHFSPASPDIFNPFSLLNCFADNRLNAYWFGSGTPTYLIEMMKKWVSPKNRWEAIIQSACRMWGRTRV